MMQWRDENNGKMETNREIKLLENWVVMRDFLKKREKNLIIKGK